MIDQSTKVAGVNYFVDYLCDLIVNQYEWMFDFFMWDKIHGYEMWVN